MLGIVHLILWLPLLLYLVQREVRTESFEPRSTYGIWTFLVTATIAVSLAFDVRDIALVAMGAK